MNSKNHNQDIHTIRQFYNEADAELIMQEIQAGDRLFEGFPAPALKAHATEAIKARLAVQLEHHRSVHRRSIVWRIVAAAAIVLIAGSAILMRLGTQTVTPTAPSNVAGLAFWESSQLSTGTDIETKFVQLEDLDLAQTLLLENHGQDSSGVADMQSELQQINSSFWEG